MAAIRLFAYRPRGLCRPLIAAGARNGIEIDADAGIGAGTGASARAGVRGREAARETVLDDLIEEGR